MLQYFSSGNPLPVSPKYAQQDFLFRWKKLERVLQKQGLQGLLLITGLDGGQHPQSAFLFNWLFLGLSGQQIYSNKYLDESYGQMVVFIGAAGSRSYIFLSPDARNKLEHLVYAAPNCQICVPTSKQYLDKEELDVLKISFLWKIAENKKKIGVSLQQGEGGKIIQKWGIIQAYALEPVGNAFFTMKVEVVNVGAKVTALYRNLDKYSMKGLVSDTAYFMAGYISGTMQLIQLTSPNQRHAISEHKLWESLSETVTSSPPESVNMIKILLGDNTASPHPSSPKNTIASTHAHHVLVMHYDPVSKLQVWRTYFLGMNRKKEPKVKTEVQEEEGSFLTKTKYIIEWVPNKERQRKKTLMEAYVGLVTALIDAIAAVSKDYRNLNQQFLSTSILSKLNPLFTSLHLAPPSSATLQLYLSSYDSFGQPKPIDFKDTITFKLTSTFYVIKCKVELIEEKGEKLGAIGFSEGFLLQQGCYLLMTKDVSYFDFWETAPQENAILDKLNPNIEFPELGACISTQAFKNRLFIPLTPPSSYHFTLSLLQIKYFFHEHGLRIHSQKTGWMILKWSDVLEASMINKISGEWVLLKLANKLLLDGVEDDAIAIEFRGKAFEMLLKKVNDKKQPLKLTFLDTIPPVLADNWYFSTNVLRKSPKEGLSLHSSQILQPDFLWSFIETKQLSILNQMKDVKLSAWKGVFGSHKKDELPKQQGKHDIIIINGGYGTGKRKLAQTISRFGPKSFTYHIYSMGHTNIFARMEPPTFLSAFQEYLKDNSIPAASPHINLLVIPSWLDSSAIIPLLSEHFSIRCVVSKIDADNFYDGENDALVEDVLVFATAGFGQVVVVDGKGEREGKVDGVTRVVSGWNREGRITRASNSVLSTGQCADIVNTNSYNSQLHKILRNKYGAFYKFPNLSNLTVHYLPFSLPLLPPSLLSSLLSPTGHLFSLSALIKDLQAKKKQAEDSKDDLMLNLYRLQERVTILKRRGRTCRVRVAEGRVRGQEGTQSNIEWVNGRWREQEVKENSKQASFGLYVIASNYDQGSLRQLLESMTYKKQLFDSIPPPLSAASLTESDLLSISKANRDTYLQNGQFFDGSFYRDVEGNILKEHPQLGRLAAEYVDKENESRKKKKEAVESQWKEYSKKYQQ